MKVSLTVRLLASVLVAIVTPLWTTAVPAQAVNNYALKFEKDVAVHTSDGVVLRANVFRPDAPGKFPVVMAHGPYGKDLHFADGYKPQWEELMHLNPKLCEGSSCKYMRWETVDPERWVPEGYVVIHVDSRGAGKSPGFLDPGSARETLDYYEAIEWAAAQPWSNGKVGLIGISYYAANQWQVAAMQPPHLAAMIPWEGYSDHYRDSTHHGGILSNVFQSRWWQRQVLPNQHGNATTAFRERDTGERTTGPSALNEAFLAGSRIDIAQERSVHALDDAYYRQRTANFSRITVPVLSAGNWGGMGLHLRGNVEGFVRAASRQKWLEMHGGTHFESFYLPEGIALQKKFFDHYLKGKNNGWDQQPRVQLTIRRADGNFSKRMEQEWPLARTQWTRFYLSAADQGLATQKPTTQSSLTYDAMSAGVTFTTTFANETEITGPVVARLWVSSSTTDMDIFATLRAFDADGKEVTFDGATDPAVPVTQGWLRVSHRKLDPQLSTPYRPYYSHDEIQKLTPGEVYPVDVEIWPTNIVLPKGYRLALTIQGKDFERPGAQGVLKGSGPFLHNDPRDRDPAEFGGKNTLLTGAERDSYLLLPIIPAKQRS